VERTISRCEIALFGNRYFSRALEEFHGERLRIGYDVNDASRVWVCRRWQADLHSRMECQCPQLLPGFRD
jgi:hypothetical protein